MECRVLEGGRLEVSKSFHGATYTEELMGWLSTKSYFSIVEVEQLQRELPQLLETMRAFKTVEREKKRQELVKQLEELK